MGKHYCSLFGCKSKSDKNKPDLSFFSLPKDEHRRKIWIQLMDRADILEQKKDYRICSLHFPKDMFIRKKIKPDAIPSLNLPGNEVLIDRSSSKKSVEIEIQVDKPVVIKMEQLDEDTNTPSDDSASETTLLVPQHSTQSEKAPKRKREELSAPFAVDPFEPVTAFVEARGSSKTEFDVFCQGVAMQLNSMPLADALRLQLELQALVTRRRLQSLRGPPPSPPLPKREPSSSCSSPV